jgi:hypothetical protein
MKYTRSVTNPVLYAPYCYYLENRKTCGRYDDYHYYYYYYVGGWTILKYILERWDGKV